MPPNARPPLAPLTQGQRYVPSPINPPMPFGGIFMKPNSHTRRKTPTPSYLSIHGTMSNFEAKRRRNAMRGYYLDKKGTVKKTNKRNSNENYGKVYPVTMNNWEIPVGNTMPTRRNSNANMYNLFNRSRHRNSWNKYFSGEAKKTRRVKNHLKK